MREVRPRFSADSPAADAWRLPDSTTVARFFKELVMGKVYAEIDANLRSFIEAQHVFFVGTAPLDKSGHVNVSPKGLDTLRVIGPQTVAYLDYVGSGAETIAHVRENGRIVIMLCAFEGPPKTARGEGTGGCHRRRHARVHARRAFRPDHCALSGVPAQPH